MIVISEPVHFGDTHLQVNSAFVALFHELFADEKILLIAEEAHTKAIINKNISAQDSIAIKPFRQYSKEGRFYWMQKVWGECRQILRLLLLARKQKPKLIIWLCLFPTGHLLLSVVNKLLFAKQKQIVILHAELEYLDKSNHSSFEKFLKFCLNTAFQLSNSHTNYIALGKHIAPTAAIPKARFHSIVHPFIFDDKSYSKSCPQPLQVCLLGTIKQSKNAHLFYKLAALFQNEINEGKIVFNAIGKVFDEQPSFRNEWVNDFAASSFIPYKDYLNLLKMQHVALFFYDETMYRFSASGAMLEAINLALPILSLKNACFESLNKEQHIGKMLKDLQEMKTEIDSILAAPEQYISSFKNSKIMFLQQNSFSLQAKSLKQIIASTGIPL